MTLATSPKQKGSHKTRGLVHASMAQVLLLPDEMSEDA